MNDDHNAKPILPEVPIVSSEEDPTPIQNDHHYEEVHVRSAKIEKISDDAGTVHVLSTEEIRSISETHDNNTARISDTSDQSLQPETKYTDSLTSESPHDTPDSGSRQDIPDSASPPDIPDSASPPDIPDSASPPEVSSLKNNTKQSSTNQLPKILKRPRKKILFWLTAPLVLAVGAIIGLSFMYPEILPSMVTLFLGFVVLIFVFFILLGLFIVFGLRKQTKQLLAIMFESGVKYIDFAEFMSKVWDDFVMTIQNVVLFFAPITAVCLAILVYYITLYSFHWVAMRSDVTVFTVVITIILASVTAILGMSDFGKRGDLYSFRTQLSFRFGRIFTDSMEIVVFLVFLTIDWQNPFFLPASVHGPITASAFGIDLMDRGIVPEAFLITLRIAGAAIFIEVVRKLYRIAAAIIIHYGQIKRDQTDVSSEQETRNEDTFNAVEDKFEMLRNAARQSFRDNLDDITKFIAFTTILVIVFFFFPRLKLLSLLFFNLTSLLWDIIFPSRTVRPNRSEDLFSRLLARVLAL